jgi:hypothetical protein
MKFTLIRKLFTERRLADTWTQASDRNEVRRAADAIDKELRLNPLEKGESRDLDRRVLLDYPPLGVLFKV